MKTSNSKKRFVLSLVVTIVSIAMLVGATFAWFTDSVTSGKNIIKSGNLDIAMYYADGTENPESVTWTDASDATIFNYDKWEPGYAQVKHIKIANVGTLALKYQVEIVADGDVGKLAEVLDVYAITPATQVTNRSALIDDYKIGTLKEVLADGSLDLTGNLMPKGSKDASGNNATYENTLTIGVKMQETANDDYQGLSIGNGFTVVVKAAQYTYEEDSFGNNYDDEATYPEVKIPQTIVVPPGKKAQDVVSKALTDATAGQTLALPANVGKIDMTGKTFAYGMTLVGNEESSIKISTGGAAPSVNANNVVFKNVEFEYGNQTYNAIRGTVIFENCTFNGLVNSYDDSTFINCTFTNVAGEYLAHVYAGTATFTGCTFNGSNRCVYVYTDGADAMATFERCTFTMTSTDKSAIMLNSRNNGESYDVTITNCIQTGGNNQGTASSDGPKYDYRGLYGFKHDPATVVGTVTVDGSIVYKYPIN